MQAYDVKKVVRNGRARLLIQRPEKVPIIKPPKPKPIKIQDPKLVARNNEIRRLKKTGRYTLQQIGDLYGISRQRVMQIVR